MTQTHPFYNTSFLPVTLESSSVRDSSNTRAYSPALEVLLVPSELTYTQRNIRTTEIFSRSLLLHLLLHFLLTQLLLPLSILSFLPYR